MELVTAVHAGRSQAAEVLQTPCRAHQVLPLPQVGFPLTQLAPLAAGSALPQRPQCAELVDRSTQTLSA